jgi:hypothetical protein
MLTMPDGYYHLKHGLREVKVKAGSKVCDRAVGVTLYRGHQKVP